MPDTRQIILSNGKAAIVDACDYEWLWQWRWCCLRTHGIEYAYRKNNGGGFVYMHRLILGCGAGEECDHRNGCGLDCRRENLRKCTHQQNQCNQKKHRGGTSPYKGVSWYPRDGKWRAIAGDKFLGYFTSEIDAARAYDEAASEMFGDFARLNDVKESAHA